ncbi:hypothetical protein F2Q69_00038056 [Brassica cretica]|uniref:Cation/H+ exchanger domain-containing protein n=1 Tax=Brassica cretica TaxID=69181 RepID=A0A8S9SIK8_BRACR|nr:hypothetical protein F2Q69_00038056 [Brassica cretica]
MAHSREIELCTRFLSILLILVSSSSSIFSWKILKENKDKKDAEFNERFKHSSSKALVRKKSIGVVLRVFDKYPDAVKVCFKRLVENLESSDAQLLSAAWLECSVNSHQKNNIDIATPSHPVTIKSQCITAIGVAGMCSGAKVVVELSKQELVQVAVLLHPSFLTVDDIKGGKVAIAIPGAEIDPLSPPALLKQFEEILVSKPEGGILLGPTALGRSKVYIDTIFPDKSLTVLDTLANIAELKLLTTDIGRMAMSAAGVNDIAAWILLALAIALSGDDSSPLVPLFGRACEGTLCLVTLTLVLAASFVTDTIGIHALFGVCVVGIVTPKEGPFCRILTEKIFYRFILRGLKTDVTTIRGAQSWGLLVLVINIGKDQKVLNDQAFAILVLMALVTTFITTPLLMAIYKPARRGAPYKHRTIQRKDHDSELRILACFHSTRNIPTLMNISSKALILLGRFSNPFVSFPFKITICLDEHLLAVWKGDRFSLLKQSFLTREIEIWVMKNKIDDKEKVVW